MRKTDEQKQAAVAEVRANIKAGMQIHEATKKAKIGAASYYAWSKEAATVSKRKKRKPQMITFEVPKASQHVVFFSGPVDSLAHLANIVKS